MIQICFSKGEDGGNFLQTALIDNVQRREAWEKVTGRAKYCDDLSTPDQLTARILTSPHAHAVIQSIDVSAALAMPGVKAVVTGRDFPVLSGAVIGDRPPLAQEKVRYIGEAVAIVIAQDEAAADAALRSIRVEYQPLPFVLTAAQALAPGAPILHEQLLTYKKEVQDVYSQGNTNIASMYKIRKGDARQAMRACDIIIKREYTLPPSDHLAMEVRACHASIAPDGDVLIVTCSQSPYTVQDQIAKVFGVPMGQVRVQVPYLGGAFGGKAPVTLELLAYMATWAVGGRPVRVVITREQDMSSAPCRMGLSAKIKLGATKAGKLQAAELTYWLDCGAYADISPYMAKAIAANCTGPYAVDNVCCDVYCVYTNHTYVTSYRGFGHESCTFCTERAMDTLAKQCGIDPWTLRYRNALKPGDTSPTQAPITKSAFGDLHACLDKLKALSGWGEGSRIQLDERTVRAKGIACLWKEATPPTNCISGALLTFNADGSVNLNTGVIEMGNGAQTRLAQMLAAKFAMDINMVHVVMGVDTRANPKHWKTVASLSAYLAGHAVMRAAEDALAQIKSLAAQGLHCQPEDVAVAGAKAYKRSNPDEFFDFKELVHGFTAPDNTSVGEPVLARGSFMLKGLSTMEPESGKGKTGPAWTVGAQAVEVELDTVDYTYRIISAGTVMDIGALMNPKASAEMISGGMAMGLSLASREAFAYDDNGLMTTPNLRSYKLLHIGQEPEYRVDFVETPQMDSPFEMRSFSEHGIVGAPAALANALSEALGVEMNALPITPEALWKAAGGRP